MATQYSNKPIVTNGLVYALDFGNQKSYVSGSNSAFNLVYSTTTSSLNSYNSGQKGVVIGNSYQFTMLDGHPYISSSYFLTQALTFLDTASEYTVTAVVEPKAGNYSGEPRYLAANLTAAGRTWGITYGTSGFTQYGINNGSVSIYSRQYPVGTSRQHVTYRYKSGSFDFFVNGVPVSASAINPSTFFRYQYGGGLTIGSPLDYLSPTPNGYAFSGSLGLFYVYNRALSSNEIYSNYLIAAQRYGLPTPAKPYSLDENAYLFLQSAGITDPIITSSINTFVLGLKSASLWDKMIAIYPFVGTGSVGVNLTGSQRWNLKEPSLVTYPLSFTGSWNGSVSGSTPSGSGTNITAGGITPSTYYPNYSSSNAHISILSYDTPTSSSMLAGTGMTREVAVSTLAGDYGTPAAAYSVRKVRTAYSGALMDVRRDYDNTTGSVGYVSNGDLDTGSLLDWVLPGRSTLPGTYSGLAAAYSLRRVSGSYTGSAIDVRRIWDNTTSSIGFDANGNLDTGSLLNFTTSGSNVSTYSNDFTQGVWTKYFLQITSSAIIGPYGLGSGSFVNETSVNNYHSFDGTFSGISTSATHSISLFVKKQERRYVGLGFAYDATKGITTVFDLDTTSSVSSGSIGPGYSVVSSTINYVTDGWFRISLTGTSQQDALYPRFFLATSSAQVNTPYPTYLGESGTGSYVYGFQYTTGSTVQPYIETTGTARYNVGNTSSFGYVTKWYDQSGNNRHATQTATGSQPLIVSSGSLVTQSGKPAIQFDGTNHALSGSLTTSGPYTNYAVCYLNTVTGFKGIFTTSQMMLLANIVGGTNWGTYGSPAEHTASSSIQQTHSMVMMVSPAGTSGTFYRNGSTDGTYPNSETQQPNGYIGGIPSQRFNGKIQEIVFWSSDQSSNRTFLENNINNYYSIYTSSNAGYVARWYDQSGNNRHATQVSESRQPQIVLSGSVVSSGTRPSLYWKTTGLDNLEFSRISNIQTVFHTSQLVETGSDQSFLLGDTVNLDYHAGSGDPQKWLRDISPAIYNGSNFINGTSYNFLTTNRDLNRNLLTLIHTSAIGISNQISIDRSSTNPRSWRGYIQEITLYTGSQASNRQAVEYGINNYYNIYPQTSSFTTSSFAIYATSGSVSASLNNDLVSGISSTGPLGFITVSRTGSNSLTIARNGVTSPRLPYRPPVLYQQEFIWVQ
jgi:uncharacterized protein YodC (DUF2158 family)